jgi:hypothetical protein
MTKLPTLARHLAIGLLVTAIGPPSCHWPMALPRLVATRALFNVDCRLDFHL